MSSISEKAESEKLIELAYRRGVVHGLHLGIDIAKNQGDIPSRIWQWRCFLENKNGIPGSIAENIKMYHGID